MLNVLVLLACLGAGLAAPVDVFAWEKHDGLNCWWGGHGADEIAGNAPGATLKNSTDKTEIRTLGQCQAECAKRVDDKTGENTECHAVLFQVATGKCYGKKNIDISKCAKDETLALYMRPTATEWGGVESAPGGVPAAASAQNQNQKNKNENENKNENQNQNQNQNQAPATEVAALRGEVAALQEELNALKAAFTIAPGATDNDRVITLNGQLVLRGETPSGRRLATNAAMAIDQEKALLAFTDHENVIRAGFSAAGKLFFNDGEGKPRKEISAEEITMRDAEGKKRGAIRETGITLRDAEEEKVVEIGHEEGRTEEGAITIADHKGITIHTKPTDVEPPAIRILERGSRTDSASSVVQGAITAADDKELFSISRGHVKGTASDGLSSFELSENGDILTRRDGETSFALKKEGLSLKKDGEDVATLDGTKGHMILKGYLSDPSLEGNWAGTTEICQGITGPVGPSSTFAARCKESIEKMDQMSPGSAPHPLPEWVKAPARGAADSTKCTRENQVSDGRGGCMCKDRFYKDRAGACAAEATAVKCAANEVSDRRGGCVCKKPLVPDRSGACIDKCKLVLNMKSDGGNGCVCEAGFYLVSGRCAKNKVRECAANEVSNGRGGCQCLRQVPGARQTDKCK